MTLAQKILVQLVGDAGLSILGFATTILIAKFLGSATLGAIGFVLGVFGLFGALLDLGFGTAHVKKIAEGGKIAEKISLYFLISLVLAIIYTLVLLIAFLIKTKTGTAFGIISFSVFLIFYFYFTIQSFAQVFLSTLQGLGEAVKYNLAKFLSALTKTILIGLVVLVGLSLLHLSLAYFAEGLLLLILSSLFIGRIKFVKPSASLFKTYFTFTLPIMLTTGVSYIFGNVDRVILGSFWNLSTVGLFFGITQISQFPQQISSSVMTFFFPEASKIAARQNLTELGKKCFLSIKYLLIIVTPILALLALFRNQFIELFLGREFLVGEAVFLIFLILAFWITIIRPYSNILFAAQIHQILPLISIFNLVLLVFLELILIPKEFFGIRTAGLGAVGAALANLAIWIVSGTFQIFWVRKHLKIGIPKSIFIQILAGFVFYFIASYLGNYLGNLFGMVLGAIFGFLVYFLTLVIFQELKTSDFVYFSKILKLQ